MLGIEVADPPERSRVVVGGTRRAEHDGLVASHIGCGIDRVRVAPNEDDVALRSRDEECRREGQPVQALEVDVTAIHHIERAGFERKLIEDVDIVCPAIGDADKDGDVAAQVDERVHLHGGLARAIESPWKQGKAEIDRGGIQSVSGVLDLDAERVVCVQGAGADDEGLRKVGEDAPVVRFVGIGQSRARDLTTDTHVVELVWAGTQAGFDVAQTLPVCELREGQAQELIPAREAAKAHIAAVPSHTPPKFPVGQKGDELRENSAAKVHAHCRRHHPVSLYPGGTSNRGKPKQ